MVEVQPSTDTLPAMPSVATSSVSSIYIASGAPLLLAINGHDRDPQTIAQIAQRCLTEIGAAHGRCVAITAIQAQPGAAQEIPTQGGTT